MKFLDTTQPDYSYLLAIDPGLATGMALINITDLNNPQIINAWELNTTEFYDKAEEIISSCGPLLDIVIENFIVTKRTAELTQAPWSLELIGVVRFLARKYYVNDLVLNKPSDKQFADNDKLRQCGFWFVGGEGHANDAFRHAVVWLVNKNPRWAKNLLV